MEGQGRISKDTYYLSIAEEVAKRSTCLKRKYGAVIVNNDEIISTGYNGAPRGCENCSDTGECLRMKLNIPSKQRYELCKSVHAEMNAIISASRKDMIGATLYLVGIKPDGQYNCATCCDMCKKMIINAGIERIVCLQLGKVVEYISDDFRHDINHMNDPEIYDDIVDDDEDGFTDEKSLFTKWRSCDPHNYEEAAKLARQIANLPEREEITK